MSDAPAADPVLIAVDWGTSSFRALLLDAAGTILARHTGPYGIMAVENGDFAGVLERETAGWAGHGPLPVLLSGMIGSRQGWFEAPYVEAPAGLAEFAAKLLHVPLPEHAIYIVPGLAVAGDAMPDVMRGEEVQVLGALAQLGVEAGSFVLPGTHSKWATVAAGRITGFRTYMTGEIFAAARGHTILGRLMVEGQDPAAFQRGVREGGRAGGPGALLNRLFGARTGGLFGRIEPSGLADYLSGLLIGAEIADATDGGDSPVHIIGAEALALRYAAAARELGVAARTVDSDCIALGHLALARAAGILAP